MRENFSYEHIKEVISAQLEKTAESYWRGKKKKKERATQDEDSDGGPTSATRQKVRGAGPPAILNLCICNA